MIKFRNFSLEDRDIIREFAGDFNPLSCEYNFSNLFCWQAPSKLSWTIYSDWLLIYDNIDKAAFMPIGRHISVKELASLSECLGKSGFQPDFALVERDYVKKLPELSNYYSIKPERDYAEYIYDVNRLYELKGKKLTKKRNLISQFKRAYPDFQMKGLGGNEPLQKEALSFAEKLLKRQAEPSETMRQEFEALKQAFIYFKELDLEGISVLVDNKVAAFSVFTPLNADTYDIQFEKADVNFKGASQIINNETAKYLRHKCRFLNKEQDLGISGLRRAKLSYDPEKIIIPYSLVFKQ